MTSNNEESSTKGDEISLGFKKNPYLAKTLATQTIPKQRKEEGILPVCERDDILGES